LYESQENLQIVPHGRAYGRGLAAREVPGAAGPQKSAPAAAALLCQLRSIDRAPWPIAARLGRTFQKKHAGVEDFDLQSGRRHSSQRCGGRWFYRAPNRQVNEDKPGEQLRWFIPKAIGRKRRRRQKSGLPIRQGKCWPAWRFAYTVGQTGSRWKWWKDAGN